MRFAGLLGNEPLKARLAASLDAGRLSHCYLISGPEGSGKRTLARLLAAAMECGAPAAPCLACAACRKVLAGAHPDVIVVDEPEKKQVPVELVRKARADAFIRPNEGRRKIFLLPRAQDLNEPAQNALLKVLEEPPPYGVFLLLADTPERLLPTIRSRCAELRLSPLEDALLDRTLRERYPDRPEEARAAAVRASGGFLGRAMALLETEEPPEVERFARAFAARDALALLELFCALEKWQRAPLTALLERLRALLAGALAVRGGAPADSEAARLVAGSRTAAELLAACGAVGEALEDCRANVGAANLCAGLFVKLRSCSAATAAG